jgi:uncharacterized protein (DUF342 family)
MEIRAYSMEDAINKASEILRCHDENIKVITIKPATSMFWGLIRRQGVYRVYIANDKEKEPEMVENQDGIIEISKVKVKVTDPTENGRYPSLVVDNDGVEVYINGNRIIDTSFVRESDWVDIRSKVVQPSTEIEVEITRDKMQAVLKIIRKPGRKYFVKDTKPCNRIFIRTGYNEIPPTLPTTEECIKSLIGAGVMVDLIDKVAIKQLLDSGSEEGMIVARGQEPIHGVDSEIQYHFSRTSYRNPALDGKGRVDLLDHTIIPTVKVGDVLAIKSLPAIPGRDGITVTGRKIKAKPGREKPLKAGKGTTLLDDSKIVATMDGRPRLEGGTVSVIPVLIIPKDVDISTGNIFFDGDVIVKGSVIKGTKVTAEGDITIYGGIYDSSVYGKGDIRVYGNVVRSKVVSGGDVIANLIVLPELKKVLDLLDNLHNRIAKLIMNGYRVSVGRFVFLSLQKTDVIKQFVRIGEKILPVLDEDGRSEFSEVLGLINSALLGLNVYNINSGKELRKIANKIRDYIDNIDHLNSRQGDVIFTYSQNSDIESSGTVVCVGKGCYQSYLIAKDSIIFKKVNSITRGGVLVAGNRIKAGTLGSPMGITTYCRVLDDKGTIEAIHYYDNTVLNTNGNLSTVKVSELGKII